MNEFSLIHRFFKQLTLDDKALLIGIGDDAACLSLPPDADLLVSTDTLVDGVHFDKDWNPYDIAYKAVAVNASDLAAMGAKPCWALLALTLPEAKTEWLQAFSQGLGAALSAFGMSLIGGDTTKGPLTITLTVQGLAPKGQSVPRFGAKPKDKIYLSGSLGAAAFALSFLKDENAGSSSERKVLEEKLKRPKPRLDLCELLRTYASAAIDISDGLGADLGHICEQSEVGACLLETALPLSSLAKKYAPALALQFALEGGDDYELCFTLSPQNEANFLRRLSQENLECYCIGWIEREKGLYLLKTDGALEAFQPRGYQHF